MLKPLIRRQIETDVNTNAQRETEVDLERELFTKRLVPGRLVPLGIDFIFLKDNGISITKEQEPHRIPSIALPRICIKHGDKI